MLEKLKNMFGGTKSKKPRHLQQMKEKRHRGLGKHGVMMRHQERMKDPNWAMPFSRRGRVPYSISGK